MASSNKKLTEEQLKESLFTNIMTKIMHGNVDRLAKALEDNPQLRKHAIEADKAVKKLEKTIKKSKATKNLMKKTKFF
jgi:hypothetical protein|tara:strand:- start:3056 stop:3289 length:234 start_codon:yes stop_codon:yes gene_type:complete